MSKFNATHKTPDGSLRFSPLATSLFITPNGEVYTYGVRLIPQQLTADGYAWVNVPRRRGKPGAHLSVHRLVASAYCAGYAPHLTVNHRDGNKLNNHYSNLEWVTREENMRHANTTGLIKKTLTEGMVIVLRREYTTGMLIREIAEKHGITYMMTYKAVTGRQYAHVKEMHRRKIIGPRKLTEEQVRHIKCLLIMGLKSGEISAATGLGCSFIRNIRTGRTYRD